jgi:hypothetical protein
MYAWNGTTWIVFTSATAITSIVAGDGLDGGGSGASVTLDVDSTVLRTTIFAAKGDLLGASANDTPVIITAASTAGYLLSVNSATASGLEWVAPSTADITGVTAGTGLTGGGTSGAVTVSLDTSSVYVVPSQTSQSGKYLTTDGSVSSWGTVASPSAATPTVAGTVLGATDSATPFETALGFEALNANTTGTNNTAVGYQALKANTTGLQNTAVGSGALLVNTTGINNIAVGSFALDANTTGQQNIAIGVNSLGANTLANNNVAIGYQTLDANTTGVSNVAIGTDALGANTIGTDNVAIGHTALLLNTTGVSNVAIGTSALDANTVGRDNVAMGKDALGANTTGKNNVAIGTNALLSNTTGEGNTAVGFRTGVYITTGFLNTAVGGFALGNNSAGHSNTAVGWQALEQGGTGNNNTALGIRALSENTASSNTAVGYQAGNTNTTGTNNTFLGNGAEGSSATTSNVITLGNASIETIRAQVTSITALSDARDKTDVESIPVGLDFINKLNPVTFTWNMRDGGKVGVKDTGFIAQELMATEDEAELAEYLQLTYRDNPEKLEATQGRLIPILVKAIQELSAKVAELEAKVN